VKWINKNAKWPESKNKRRANWERRKVKPTNIGTHIYIYQIRFLPLIYKIYIYIYAYACACMCVRRRLIPVCVCVTSQVWQRYRREIMPLISQRFVITSILTGTMTTPMIMITIMIMMVVLTMAMMMMMMMIPVMTCQTAGDTPMHTTRTLAHLQRGWHMAES